MYTKKGSITILFKIDSDNYLLKHILRPNAVSTIRETHEGNKTQWSSSEKCALQSQAK